MKSLILLLFFILAAALTEFSPERKKKQQYEPPQKKPDGKKKQTTKATKKILRTRPAKYHYLIPPNTPEAARVELEQRQRPVSTVDIELFRKKGER